MKKSLNRTLIIVLSFLFIFCSALTLAFGTSNVSATEQTPSFVMDTGMSIKLKIEDKEVVADNSGIRFVAKLNQAYIDSAEAGSKYKMMIIPSEWLKNSKLSGEEVDYVKVLTDPVEEGGFGKVIGESLIVMESIPVLNKKDGLYDLKGTISKVKAENLTRDFIGIAFRETNGVRDYADFDVDNNARNITEVASSALNDKVTMAEYEDAEVPVPEYLNGIVETAYPNLEVSAPAAVNLALEAGKTYDLNAFATLPKEIDVDYTISDDSKATVENGVITINETGATATVKATVLGTEYTLANLVADKAPMNGFDTESSKSLIWNAVASSGKVSSWLDKYEDINGVVKNGVANINTKNGSVDIDFDFTATQLKSLNLTENDIVRIVFAVDKTQAWDIALTFSGVKLPYVNKTWTTVDLKISDFLAETSSFDDCASIDEFCERAARYNNGLRIRSQSGQEVELYVDSLSIIKVDVANVQPVMGEEFAIPTATLKGFDNSILTIASGDNCTVTYKTSATATAQSVVVTDGKFTPSVGIYNLEYSLNYGGQDISYVLSYTIERTMPENALEDFGWTTSKSNVWNLCAGDQSPEQKAQHQWLESYIDGSSETKTGVVSVNAYGNKFGFKVNKTVEELKALNLDANDTISITVMFTGLTYNAWSKIMGVSSNTITPNKWTTISVSVGDLITANTDLDTLINKIAKDTGTSVYGEMQFNAGAAATYYFDEITFTKNA